MTAQDLLTAVTCRHYPKVAVYRHAILKVVPIIFDQEGRNTVWKKDSLFNKWRWSNWMSACREIKIENQWSTAVVD